MVLWHDFQPPEPLLQKLSSELDTQVIWLAFQKQVDGDPEAWEAAAIFDDGRLERRFSGMRRLGGEFSYTPEAEESLRQLWKGRHLAVDREEPSINARDVAEAVALEYHLPGWA